MECIRQYVDLAIKGEIDIERVEVILKDKCKQIGLVTMLSLPMENDIVYGVKEVLHIIENLVKIRKINRNDLNDLVL